MEAVHQPFHNAQHLHTSPLLNARPSQYSRHAYHELVGGVVDYVKYPSRNGFRLIEGETEIDTQSWLLTALIGASTAIRMPQLARPFNKFFGAGGAPAWERDVWDSFTSDLEGQSKKVQAADADRSVEFKYFDPARFECSVSV